MPAAYHMYLYYVGVNRSLLTAAASALLLFAAGCSTTVESQPEVAKAMESKNRRTRLAA